MSKPIICKRVSTFLNTQLWLKGDCVAEEMLSNEYFCSENSKSEDESGQCDSEWNEDEHDLFLFAEKHIDIIIKQTGRPLERIGCNIPALKTEFLNVLDHAKKHITINTLSYVESWLMLFQFTNPGYDQWNNILILVELCFVLPVSNTMLDRCFSFMQQLQMDWQAT